MRSTRDKTALVTGAASGIGRATSIELARRGARLIICDVDEDGLGQTRAEIDAISQCLLAKRVDVASRDEMAALGDEVRERFESVDILVNNAGVGLSGGVLDLELADWDWILSINLWGVIHGCHYLIPPMVERGRGGHVVNLSSFLGFWGIPRAIAYATSKFAVLGFSESLRSELHPYGIGVSAICPGIIKTNVVRATRFRGADDPDKARDLIDRTYARRNYRPERVAKAIVNAIRHDRGVVPVTPEAHGVYLLKRLSPKLADGIARAFTGITARIAGERLVR